MFCDQCGTALQTGQGFCNSCGKQITGAVIGYPLRSRLQEHLRLLSILWFAFSAFEALGAVVLFVIANTLMRHIAANNPDGGLNFLTPLLSVVAMFIAAKSVAGFLAGWGLLQRERWARPLALVLAFLAFLHVPFGLALGVYTLWVLLPAHSEEEYERFRQASAA
jgi:hypothetical protein